MTNDKAHRRRRGVWLGLLVLLLLMLGGYGYAQSSSPSATTGPSKSNPTDSSSVLAPRTAQTAAAQTSAPTGSGTTAGASSGLVLAPAASSSGTGNGNGNNGNCVEPSNATGNCDHSLGVKVGQAPTLYPGVNRSLPVTYSNSNAFDILVASYRVSVSVPSSQATACPAANLLVPSGTIALSPQLTVTKKGSTTTSIPIKLAATAPDGCQRVIFTITVIASAVKK